MKCKNIVLSLAIAITFAATASYNDLSSALDSDDPTNGGYWNAEERLSKYLPNPEVKSSGSSPIEARAAASAVSGAASPIDGDSRSICESLPAGLDFFLKKLFMIFR
jgi:hypothetical protein